MTKDTRLQSVILMTAMAIFASPSRAVDLDPNFFQQKILPVLESKCYKCHSAKTGKSKGGLQLDTPNRLKLGGETGPALKPGHASQSLLITALQYNDPDFEMPPKGKLPDQVINDFITWINAGAPDNRKPQPVHDVAFIANTATSYSQKKAADLWSFTPPQKSPPAPTSNTTWPRTGIDRYIIAQLDSHNLTPAPDASSTTLLRRIYFDLIGLPPSPQNVTDFLADKSLNPIANVIDELLASKNFGEHWARHWLDVARYAESNGGDSNVTYPHAFRYRDYVINAFNADIPYDTFIQQQIAGDLLKSSSPQEKAQNTVATGFLAIGHKNLNERNFTQFQLDLVDEQIDAVSRAFLGLTIACARCHDHKFDPISAADYYAFAGIFTSSNTQYGTLHTTDFNNNSTGLIPIQVTDATQTLGSISPAQLENIKRQLADTQRQLRELRPSLPGGRNRPAPQSTNGMDAVQLRRSRLRLNMNYDALEAQLYDYDAQGNALTHAMAVVESRPQNSPLYLKGEASNPGPTIPRGFLKSLASPNDPVIPHSSSGRLELAQWIASPTNPLTSRVIVNRIWGRLFGRGLVTTPNNFGAMGQPPTHPKLLDALAIDFGDNGYSIKKLIRSLMLSRTYQLSSTINTHNYNIDPDNTYLWRSAPRPLQAETLRDTVLYLAGSLTSRPLRSQTYDIGNTPLGGRRGFRINQFNFNVNYRSIYLPIWRDYLPDSLSLFDFADPSMIVGQRDATIVPSQALFLLNSDFIQTQADYFALWILADYSSAADRINAAYQWTLTRQPTQAEITKAQSFLKRYAALIANETTTPDRVAFAAFIQSLFASSEFRYLN